MKKTIFKAVATAALLLGAPSLFAQTLVMPNQTGVITNAGQTFVINYTPGADSGSFNFFLNGTPAANLTLTAVTGAIPNGTATCAVNPGLARVSCNVVAPADTVDLGAGTITVTYTGGATAGPIVFAFDGANTAFFDQLGNVEPAGTATGGTLTLALGPQPTYSSVPAPASTIVISDVVGGTATTSTLAITNTGAVGSTLNVTAATGLTGILSVAGAPLTLAQGASGNLTISCNATAAGPGTPQTLTVAHNGPGPNSTYTVRCDGSLGPSGPTLGFTPAGATPITIPASGSGTAVTFTIVVTPTGGQAPESTSLACSVTGTGIATPVVTGSPFPAPGAAAGSIGLAASGTATTGTLTCIETRSGTGGSTVTTTWPLTVTSAPGFASTPADGGTLNIIGITGSTATGAVSVSNPGTAPLTIAGCTVTGAGLTLGTVSATVAPGAVGSIGVSCAVPTTAGATLTGTLACTTNAAAPSDVINYNVTCTAQSASIPALGLGGKALLVLLMLGFGLVGFQLYRRAA
jgi:hypothetical protein